MQCASGLNQGTYRHIGILVETVCDERQVGPTLHGLDKTIRMWICLLSIGGRMQQKNKITPEESASLGRVQEQLNQSFSDNKIMTRQGENGRPVLYLEAGQ